MKQYLILTFLVSVLFLTGCKTIFNKIHPAQTEEKRGRDSIEHVEQKLASNLADRMDAVSTLAFGTGYALDKIESPSDEVIVAKDMNDRVMSVAGSPSLEKLKEMQSTIDNLVSTLDNERIVGKRQLLDKDRDIMTLQEETRYLKNVKDAEIRRYIEMSQAIAAKADAYKGELNSMDSFMGLGAIWYGIKKFIFGSAWILGISGVIFLLLRIFASSNPIAAAAFSVFNILGGYVVNAIKVILPKAIDSAGHVSKELYIRSTLLLEKIVDSIQSIKEIESRTGRDVTLKEVLVELDKSLDVSEKEKISNIKKELGY
jgi:predicted  nucleic acid-binding Zn-ribbon protein